MKEIEIQSYLPSDSEKPDFSDREYETPRPVDPEKDPEFTGADSGVRSATTTTTAAAAVINPSTSSSAPEVSSNSTDAQPTTAPAGAGAGPGPGPIPNGGMEAWIQVLGSWVALIATWGLVNTYGVFQTYYETVLLTSSSSSAISWIGSIQASLLMFVGVFVGPLYDAGHFRKLLIAGFFFVVFGQFMTSLGTQYWHILLAQGFCIGTGMGMLFLPTTAILAQYFTTRRAFAIGVASTGSPLAGIVFPIIFSQLVDRIGFGWATRVIAFILLGLSVIPVTFMKTRVPPSGRKRAMIDQDAIRDPVFVLFVVASFFMFMCLYISFFYIQLFDELHHLSSTSFSPYIVTLLNVGSVFGRVIPNYLADKLGSLNIILASAAVSAILVYGWMGIHNLGGIVTFALLYGLFSGGIVSVTPSAVMTMTPDISRLGTRMGMVFMLAGFAILIGTPIGGAILGGFSESEWLGVIGYAAAGLTVGVIMYTASRVILFKRNGKKVA